MKKISLLLIVVITFAACSGDKKGNNAEQLAKLKKERADLDAKISKLEAGTVDTTKKATSVSVITLQPTNFSAYIEVQSAVMGDQNVYATPQAPGTVTSISVKAGDHVAQGQVLATLDAAQIEQQIKGQDAQLQLTKSLYEKQQKLWAQNIGTEVQLLQAKTNYEAALKGKEATMAGRNMYRIISPISGIVDQIDAKIGQMSGVVGNPGGIRVVNNTQLKAEANLGENYLGKVATGDKVTLILPDIQDSITTKLSYVAQAVDPVSRSFVAQVKLNSDKKLHPNMSCIMRITNYEHNGAIVVPVTLIQKTAAGEMIYIADGNTAKSVNITTGKNSNGMVEVLSGLKEGDKVINEGFREVDNGEAITIQ